ncbi:MAG TPA: lytic transglycosylase domain-containing protein, partial [Thermoanaerobaculia bacterium]|nr:lytic transglycosylase domain-containing protein [Thermoanaerobaculia bacterium]
MSYGALASAINPVKYKFVVQRRRVGTIKVKVEGKPKPVVRPKYANVKTRVAVPDPVAKAKKEGYERMASERLEDLLLLPLADGLRIEALGALVAAAEAKNQDKREQDLVVQLVKIDPSNDAGLQHFWDEAWSAYTRGDLETASPLFAFIAGTYHGPNTQRQASYWHARCLERSGHGAEAATIYRALGGAPYDDVYALYARKHGVAAPPRSANPLTIARADWRDVAERNMPVELRLAYELTALSDVRDARIEIQKNLSHKNQPYAEALLADLYASSGSPELMMRSLRRAFPQIATVEQDAVPPYFIRMYYPTRYEDLVVKYSKRNGVDPFIVMGLILQESAFNPRARSGAGATGLMQLMPATGKELGRRVYGRFAIARLDDPDTNIELGTMHFRHLVDLFDGNVLIAVASYNAGQGNVQKWQHAAPGKPTDEFVESIPFSETRSYVKRVTLLASTYKRLSE